MAALSAEPPRTELTWGSGHEAPDVLSGGVRKSCSDDRDYRAIVLHNFLEAVLISDPQTDMSGAALSVRAGSWQNPPELPGLAHLLEHMLFLGTDKYPDESSYRQYLNENGGSSNAYTAAETTNFHFEVLPKAFEGALDRFAQFFMCPLFTASATARELLAVDSENSKNIENDFRRLFQVSKATSNPDHVYCGFGTGDIKTLRDVPAAAGIDVRSAFLAFHERHYRARVMKLAVCGMESLDVLEQWVRTMFSFVNSRGAAYDATAAAAAAHEVPPFRPGRELGIIISVTPVRDMRRLEFAWPLPPQDVLWRSKPGQYVARAIAQQGPCSLMSILRVRGLAVGLTAGITESYSAFSIITASIELTELGVERVDDIAGAFFHWVDLLRRAGPQEECFREMQAEAAIAFRFKDKGRVFAYVTEVAAAMQLLPPEYCLCGGALAYDYDPGSIAVVLEALSPASVRMRFIARGREAACPLIEKWYGCIKYGVAALEAGRVQMWRASSPPPELTLPARNIFIASDFSLSDRGPAAALPLLLRDDASARIFFSPNSAFLLPKTVLNLRIVSPCVARSPSGAVMARLFTMLVKEALTEFAYFADIAGLCYTLSVCIAASAVDLEVCGFSEKLPVLAVRIGEAMAGLRVSDSDFERQRDVLDRDIANFAKEMPYLHAIEGAAAAIEVPHWRRDDMLAAVRGAKPAAFRDFAGALLARFYCEALVHGNASPQSAAALVTAVMGALGAHAALSMPERLALHPRAVLLPYHLAFRLPVPAPNAQEANAAVHVLLAVGPATLGATQGSLVELVAHFVRDRAFMQLRTREQLGYIVLSAVCELGGHAALSVTVQSSTHEPVHLESRVDAFLQSMSVTLRDLTPSVFAANVASARAALLEAPKSLREEHVRQWHEVSSGAYVFDRRKAVAEAMAGVSQGELVAFYDAVVAPGGPRRRKLVVHVLAGQSREPRATSGPGLLPSGDSAERAAVGIGYVSTVSHVRLDARERVRLAVCAPLAAERAGGGGTIEIEDIDQWRSWLQFGAPTAASAVLPACWRPAGTE